MKDTDLKRSHTFRVGDPYSTKCKICGKTIQQLIDQINRREQGAGELIDNETLDKYEPCLTLDEAVVKDILE